ncbi:non-specific lipid-transfer protein 5 isoform X2 [Medicago truncatula]|uniref:Lipid transfer protein n=1 Tax=Medicago truncatula TaxID=3880 RepID=G7JIC9_MEDTR|nr:non-specific lipid-transfer protein 5 isoform X2 [Medicago truncatula]AES87505.1 Lipid transfer protein [Medicago truncatula]AFK45511.1 unknown [Medicago truncatula]
MKVACLVLVLCIVVAHIAEADRFAFIIYTLTPCYPFLIGSISVATPHCCEAVKEVDDDAKDYDDRLETCDCLRDMALSFKKDFNVENGAALFALCGIQTPYQISRDINCTKIIERDEDDYDEDE